MAEIVEDRELRRRGRPPKYPWDEWIDGQTRIAVRGKDFNCKPASFRALLHRTASARGLKSPTTEIDGDRVLFLFHV